MSCIEAQPKCKKKDMIAANENLRRYFNYLGFEKNNFYYLKLFKFVVVSCKDFSRVPEVCTCKSMPVMKVVRSN